MTSISLSPAAQAGPAGHSCMSSCKNRPKNGKEHENCYSILGLYRDNGKENETTIVYWGYSLEILHIA